MIACMTSIPYRELINRDLPLLERGCTSKAMFISRREAQNVKRHGRHQDGSVRPYRCRYCDWWHLGH
jgi:hypothetical protein